MIKKISLIELHLEDWTRRYPTGIILYDYTINEIDSDYADNADEYIRFLKEYEEQIRKDRPTIRVICDLDDLDNSTVLDCAKEIKAYLDKVRFDKEEKEE